VWHGDEITVDAQGPPEFDDSFPVPAWDTPPCAPPPGGWPLMSDPDGIGDLNLQWPEDRDGPEVVTAITFRPSRRQLVAVIASTDPDLTRRRLEPSLGDRLCVVASRWTARQVEQVRERLHAGDWLALTSAQTPDETGQAVVEVYVREVVESFAAYARELPDGLLRVRAWLKPARHPV
jgi:hypothetical protein